MPPKCCVNWWSDCGNSANRTHIINSDQPLSSLRVCVALEPCSRRSRFMSCRRLAVLAFLTILVPAHGALAANTYYVAPTTTGTANGSITNPFTSFTTAMNTAVAGDTIYVRG